MCSPEFIASTYFETVLTFVLWLLSGWLAAVCTQNNFVNFVQQFVMSVLQNVQSFKMLIAKRVLTNAVSVLTNAARWLNNKVCRGRFNRPFVFISLNLSLIHI